MLQPPGATAGAPAVRTEIPRVTHPLHRDGVPAFPNNPKNQ